MGWNSWNTFGKDINEEVVRGVADKMVELGMKDLGYQYVVIDDHRRFPRSSKLVGSSQRKNASLSAGQSRSVATNQAVS
jgi:hypothetical protein